MDVNLKYNPKNTITAFLYFFFGSFLTWWSFDKIEVFTSIFDNGLPQMLVWFTFILLFATWIFLVPFLVLTGASITVGQFLKTFVYGFMGLLSIIVILPIMSTLIPIFGSIFDNTFIDLILWFVTFTIVLYLAIYRPIGVLYES